MPIRNDEQRALLEEAEILSGRDSLIPRDRQYITQLRVYERRTQALVQAAEEICDSLDEHSMCCFWLIHVAAKILQITSQEMSCPAAQGCLKYGPIFLRQPLWVWRVFLMRCQP